MITPGFAGPGRRLVSWHLAARLREQRITLAVPEATQRYLAEAGFDPPYRARPLRRAIQQLLQNLLAKLLITGDLTDGSKVTVDLL